MIGLIALVGVGIVASLCYVSESANKTPPSPPSVGESINVSIERIWSSSTLSYYPGWADSDLRYPLEYEAGEGLVFIILDMHVTNTGNERIIFQQPYIVDGMGVESYPFALEGDAHFGYYYRKSDYYSKMYKLRYWRSKLSLLGERCVPSISELTFGRWKGSHYTTVVYRMPVGRTPIELYYTVYRAERECEGLSSVHGMFIRDYNLKWNSK